MNHISLKILLFSCITLVGAINAYAKDPEFPVPNNTVVSIVGENMTVGGRTMDIRQFYTNDDIDRFKRFYYQKWEKGEIKDLPGYLETHDNPPWHIISRLEQGFLLTVQAQSADNGGTWGYLAMSKLVQEDAPQVADSAVPKLPGSRIIHDIHSEDIGQSGVTMIITNDKSMNSNTDYYKNYYEGHGWRTDLDQHIAEDNSYVLAFTKGLEKVNLVFRHVDKSTYITVNKVTHDLL